jgi:hypothetical protein
MYAFLHPRSMYSPADNVPCSYVVNTDIGPESALVNTLNGPKKCVGTWELPDSYELVSKTNLKVFQPSGCARKQAK